MKKSFLAVAAVCLLTASAAQAQDARFTARSNRARTTIVAPVTPTSDGAVLRTVRASNPVQMVNPTAPVGYGNGQQVTRHEDSDPYQRPQGIKLVTIEF